MYDDCETNLPKEWQGYILDKVFSYVVCVQPPQPLPQCDSYNKNHDTYSQEHMMMSFCYCGRSREEEEHVTSVLVVVKKMESLSHVLKIAYPV